MIRCSFKTKNPDYIGRGVYTGGSCSGQFFSACSFFPSKSFKQGAKNISPVAAVFTVRAATMIQSNVTATEKIYVQYVSLPFQTNFKNRGLLTVPRTLKKVDGNSFAICVVLVVNTPSGKVNPINFSIYLPSENSDCGERLAYPTIPC
jgi:hypothetical protein